MTSSSRRLGYTLITRQTVNRLKVSFKLSEIMISESLKLSFNLLTAAF